MRARKRERLAVAALLVLLGCAAMRAGAQAPGATLLRAAHDITRGAVLTLPDIDATGGQADDARTLVGWVARRVIRQGESLKEPAVMPAPLVQAGATVTIEAVAGGVTATRTGVAIGSGVLGGHVRVRLDAYRIVTAIITGPTTVRIP